MRFFFLFFPFFFYLFIYLFGRAVQHVGSQFPDQGLNLCPLHWKHGVLTTGLPGKFRDFFFLILFIYILFKSSKMNK